ncbi:acyl-CoA thioesterase [Arthrobacter sp. JZ12]|uniref:acyl-CoA thioesterase n=1 Tax=Arthrobacter sp. JZ12 TaxID=2654190 RepID=UPI002B461F41|nr:thioesterase family protein [Arthrobacter sp. JZ12]WRH24120.1 acyl-CoA thioesterase [Arthrobacter sp. JZ12]
MDAHQTITCEIPMRWGDMDAYGHINNVQVVRILEEARIFAFGPPGGTGAPGQDPPVALFSSVPSGVQALVVEHRVKYTATLDYRNVPLKVEVWIAAVSAASLTIAYRIHDPLTDQVCVKAQTVLAFVDGETGSLQRVTAGQKELVAPYLGPALFKHL